MFSVVHASRDADGAVVEHIPSARPPANPTSLIPPRLFHPVIRVDLRVTFARLVIAHVLLVSLTSFLERAQLHVARSLGAEKHRFPMLADGSYALHIRSREPPRRPAHRHCHRA